MPNFPWPARREASATEDAVLAALLAGKELATDTGAWLQPVADVLAALRAEPASDELAGLTVAQAEFRHRVGVSDQLSRSRPRRPTLLKSILSAKAVAAAIAAVSLAGAATAAYAGALPDSLQQFAHHTIGAPAAHRAAGPTTRGTPVGPNATGHAAYGLCTAYRHATEHGTAAQKAVAFRNLVKAAGGAGSVAAFCATVHRPGPSASPSPHPTGRPSSHPTHPTGGPTSHPTGQPTSRPTGQPSSHPTGPPTS